MEVILLERVAKLGQMGEVVRVKDGFARNFLLPQGKALRATKDNRTKFEGMKAQLETRNLELKGDAEKVAEFYHPALRMDGSVVGLDVSERGGACGVGVEKDGTPVIEMQAEANKQTVLHE